LLERVTLSVVSQDGMRVRAAAKAASLRRRGRLDQFLHQARGQIEALKAELDEDAGASTRRKQAARERALREREQRIARALVTLHEIEARVMKMADGRFRPAFNAQLGACLKFCVLGHTMGEIYGYGQEADGQPDQPGGVG
jgi:hypothetical protein